MTKLSHSQCQRYQMCPQSYYFHYIKKVRPNVQSAALIFGSALDNALNQLLVPKGNDTPEQVFDRDFTKAFVNKVMTFIPTFTQVVYANTDFDAELLEQDDFNELSNNKIIDDKFKVEPLIKYDELKKKKQDKGFDCLSFPEKIFFNQMNWYSLRRKGLLMLSEYRRKVLPKIETVRAVQKQVSLVNESGDEVIGYIDLVADIKGHGTVIIDHKTSAMEYDEDSVLTSPQLTLYMHILKEEYNTRKAGYIVLRKQIKKNRKKKCSKCSFDGSGARHKTCSNIIDGKRCDGEWIEKIDPEVDFQIIIDNIPEQTENIVLENIDSINEAIKAEVFHRNLNTCSNYYGGKCPYFNLCYKNNMNGLVQE